jgi:hypothetical protein
MEIKEQDFHVWYDEQTQTVTCLGALRLAGMSEYAPIIKLLDDVIQQEPSTLKLDLTQLSFLNSSGINAISKFVLKLRQHPETQLTVQGSNEISWQSKSLPNLKRLMPNLNLQLV